MRTVHAVNPRDESREDVVTAAGPQTDDEAPENASRRGGRQIPPKASAGRDPRPAQLDAVRARERESEAAPRAAASRLRPSDPWAVLAPLTAELDQTSPQATLPPDAAMLSDAELAPDPSSDQRVHELEQRLTEGVARFAALERLVEDRQAADAEDRQAAEQHRTELEARLSALAQQLEQERAAAHARAAAASAEHALAQQAWEAERTGEAQRCEALESRVAAAEWDAEQLRAGQVAQSGAAELAARQAAADREKLGAEIEAERGRWQEVLREREARQADETQAATQGQLAAEQQLAESEARQVEASRQLDQERADAQERDDASVRHWEAVVAAVRDETEQRMVQAQGNWAAERSRAWGELDELAFRHAHEAKRRAETEEQLAEVERRMVDTQQLLAETVEQSNTHRAAAAIANEARALAVTQARELEAQIEAIRAEFAETFELERADAQQRLSGVEAERATATQRAVQAERDQARLQQGLDEAAEQLVAARADASDIEQVLGLQLSAAREHALHAEQAMVAAELQLAAARQTHDDVEHALAASEQHATSARDRVSELEQALDVSMNELDTEREGAAELDRALDDATNQLASVQTRSAVIERHLGEMEAEARTAHETYDQEQARLEQALADAGQQLAAALPRTAAAELRAAGRAAQLEREAGQHRAQLAAANAVRPRPRPAPPA